MNVLLLQCPRYRFIIHCRVCRSRATRLIETYGAESFPSPRCHQPTMFLLRLRRVRRTRWLSIRTRFWLVGCADTSDGLCLLSHWHVLPLWYVSTGHARSCRIKQAWGTKLYSYVSPHSPSRLRSFTNSRVVTVTISMT